MSINSNAIKKIDDQIKFLVSDDNHSVSNEKNVEKNDDDIEILDDTIKVSKLDDIKSDIELLDNIDENTTKKNNTINGLYDERNKFIFDKSNTNDDIKDSIDNIDDGYEDNAFFKYYVGIVFFAIILIVFIYFLFK